MTGTPDRGWNDHETARAPPSLATGLSLLQDDMGLCCLAPLPLSLVPERFVPGMVNACGICSFGGSDGACVSQRDSALQCRLK
jgi:hypothetical protein